MNELDYLLAHASTGGHCAFIVKYIYDETRGPNTNETDDFREFAEKLSSDIIEKALSSSPVEAGDFFRIANAFRKVYYGSNLVKFQNEHLIALSENIKPYFNAFAHLIIGRGIGRDDTAIRLPLYPDEEFNLVILTNLLVDPTPPMNYMLK